MHKKFMKKFILKKSLKDIIKDSNNLKGTGIHGKLNSLL